jgi:superfamily II DNA/RNA helicase
VVKHTPRRRDTSASEKRELLRRIIRGEGDALTNGIIFCNRKVDVDILAKSLKRHGFDAQAMHGDLDQKLRMKILQAFRDGELKLLIASDVAARGLDIPNVSHIFNFDVPIHSEDYVHRIGRTGRAGRWGKSFTLALPSDGKYLAKIEELVKQAIPVVPSPLGADEELAPHRRPERPARAPQRERRHERRVEERAPAAAPSQPAVPPAPTPTQEPRPARGGRPERGRVPGMGDHVPAFLLREFRVEPDLAPEAAEAAAEIDASAPLPAAEPAADTPKPRRRSRSRPAGPEASGA